MRLWSLHPAYLDAKGLVALWREALLAKAVLMGKTYGYRRHPQLDRFRSSEDPVAAINCYLASVLAEAEARGYSFDKRKVNRKRSAAPIPVTRGQLAFERRHLKAKLAERDPGRAEALEDSRPARAHPLFRAVPGGVECWERGGS
jgi:hypothetical protein